jgi:hypothetical protein
VGLRFSGGFGPSGWLILDGDFEMAALKNQDKILSEPLSLDENYKAPDWENWMKSEISNPKEVKDWSGGHGALDPFAFSHYLRSNDCLSPSSVAFQIRVSGTVGRMFRD